MATLAKLTSQSTQTLSLLLERQRLQTLSGEGSSLHLPQITRNLQQLRTGILDLEEKEGNIEAVRLLKSQYERMRGMLGPDAEVAGVQRCVRRVLQSVASADPRSPQVELSTASTVVQCNSARFLYTTVSLEIPVTACRLAVQRRSPRRPLCALHRRPGGRSPAVYGRYAARAEAAHEPARPPFRQPVAIHQPTAGPVVTDQRRARRSYWPPARAGRRARFNRQPYVAREAEPRPRRAGRKTEQCVLDVLPPWQLISSKVIGSTVMIGLIILVLFILIIIFKT